MEDSLEMKVVRIEEKIEAIEKIAERINVRFVELEKFYVKSEFYEKSINQITKELTEVAKQQSIFRAFAAGIGFSFSILGATFITLLKKFFTDN